MSTTLYCVCGHELGAHLRDQTAGHCRECPDGACPAFSTSPNRRTGPSGKTVAKTGGALGEIWSFFTDLFGP